jgi:hypothetical protein
LNPVEIKGCSRPNNHYLQSPSGNRPFPTDICPAANAFSPSPRNHSTLQRSIITLAVANVALRSTNWKLASGNPPMPSDNRHGTDDNPPLASDIGTLSSFNWKLPDCFVTLATCATGKRVFFSPKNKEKTPLSAIFAEKGVFYISFTMFWVIPLRRHSPDIPRRRFGPSRSGFPP